MFAILGLLVPPICGRASLPVLSPPLCVRSGGGNGTRRRRRRRRSSPFPLHVAWMSFALPRHVVDADEYDDGNEWDRRPGESDALDCLDDLDDLDDGGGCESGDWSGGGHGDYDDDGVVVPFGRTRTRTTVGRWRNPFFFWFILVCWGELCLFWPGSEFGLFFWKCSEKVKSNDSSGSPVFELRIQSIQVELDRVKSGFMRKEKKRKGGTFVTFESFLYKYFIRTLCCVEYMYLLTTQGLCWDEQKDWDIYISLLFAFLLFFVVDNATVIPVLYRTLSYEDKENPIHFFLWTPITKEVIQREEKEEGEVECLLLSSVLNEAEGGNGVNSWMA